MIQAKKVYLKELPYIFIGGTLDPRLNTFHLYESDEFYEELQQAIHLPLEFICELWNEDEVLVFREKGTKKYGYLIHMVTGIMRHRITKYSKTREQIFSGTMKEELNRFSLYQSDEILGVHDCAMLLQTDDFLGEVSDSDDGFKVFRKKGTKKYGYVVDDFMGIIVRRFTWDPISFTSPFRPTGK